MFITLTMEETFIVTGIAALVIGSLLGLLTYWAFDRDTRDEGGDEE